MWEKFAENNVAEITRFEARSCWNDDAAQLHLALAAQYAAQRNEKCVDEIRIAYEMGVDVKDALKEAESHFDPGIPLVRIRLAEIELLGDDAEEELRMPTGNTSGEYSALASEIYGSTGSTSDATAYANYRSALRLPLSGYFYSGSANYQGSYGYWWSSTRNYNRNMYFLYANTSNIYPASNSNRGNGNSVRCVLGS